MPPSDAIPRGIVGGLSFDRGLVLVGPGAWSIAILDGDRIVARAGTLPLPGRWVRMPLVRGLAAAARQARGVREAMRSVGLPGGGAFALFLALGFLLGLMAMPPAQWLVRTLQPHGLAWLGVAAIGLAGVWLAFLASLGFWTATGRFLERFRFHAAEHMAIAAWEVAGESWQERLSAMRKEHVRCGHSLLPTWIGGCLLADLAILALAPPGAVHVAWVAAAVAWPILLFELRLHRWLAWFWRLAAVPGLGLQLLSTRRPQARHLDVARAAGRALLERQGAGSEPAAAT